MKNIIKRCDAIFAIWQKENPSPTTELHYTSIFELLLAVILSAQTTDKQVNIVTQQLFAQATTPQDIIALGETKIMHIIKSIGLFRTKAKHIMQTCILLQDTWQGKVPCTRAELESLPGVGRKTANVILNTFFHEPVIAVDTHVTRVSQRLKFSEHKLPKQIEADLMQIIPTKYHLYAHHWLILHGRYICTSRPLCAKCTIKSLCPYNQKTD